MRIIQLDRNHVSKEYGYLTRQHPEIFKIPSHTNAREKSLIYRLCRELPSDSTIVEIGSDRGATSLTMGIAAKGSSFVHCVDTWDRDLRTGKKINDTSEAYRKYNQFLDNTAQCGHWVNSSMKESTERAKEWAEWKLPSIDLIFFDADHSYEGITSDIKAWTPLCAPGAWLVFHDHSGKYGRPAIQRAVEELVWPIQDGPGYVLESIYWCKKR